MHHVIQSNHTDSLFSLFAELMRLQPFQQNPLKPLSIIVPNKGMEQWLKQALAKEFGIAANVQCLLPSRWLWQSYRMLLGAIDEQLPIEKPTLRWQLFNAFRQDGFLDDIDLPYPLDNALKAFQLADTLGDLFDQYLMYREPMIAGWEAGQDNAHYPWQSQLWRKLIQSLDADGPLHQGQAHRQFLAALKSGQQLPEASLLFFGFASYEPIIIDAIEALAANHEVYSFIPMPCREYWADQSRAQLEELAHPLLASWGAMGRDFSRYLIEQEALDTTIRAFDDYPASTLLGQLQQSVFEANAETQIDYQPQDFSLTFHRCYSPLREIEVLHDQILHALESDPSLEPSDITVMATDLELYQPYIDSVFQHQTEVHIPFSISTSKRFSDEPEVRLLMQLIDLPKLNADYPTLMEWLDNDSFRQAFEISEEEVDAISQWIELANIRWGLNKEHQAELGVDINQNSWAFGLERLLTGYFMAENQFSEPLYQGSLAVPMDNYDGIAVTIEKLTLLLDKLSKWRQSLRKTQTLVQWHQLLQDMLNEAFCETEANRYTLINLRKQLDQLLVSSAIFKEEQQLEPEVLRYELQRLLSQTQRNAQFLRGGVNFTSLQPLRSLPFKAIFILGLNQNDYPRQDQRISMDLMQFDHQLGDRSPSLEDKYLLLEALMSAEQRLGIFWQGWKLTNNADLFPSPLVLELQDVIKRFAGVDALNAISHEHSLHSFDDVAYEPQDKQPLLRSYRPLVSKSSNSIWEKVDDQAPINSTATSDPADQSIPAPYQNIELTELIAFFSSPMRHLLKRLGVDFYEQKIADPHEPFALDKPSDRRLRAELLDEALNSTSSSSAPTSLALHKQKASGAYPVRLESIFHGQEELSILSDMIREHRVNATTESYEAHFEALNLSVEGQIELFDGELFAAIAQSCKSNDIWINQSRLMVELRLKWLLANCRRPTTAKLLSFEASRTKTAFSFTVFEGIDSAQALSEFSQLIQLYLDSFERQIAFDNYCSNRGCSKLKEWPETIDSAFIEQFKKAANMKRTPFIEERQLFPEGLVNSPDFVRDSLSFWGRFMLLAQTVDA